jgi:hypothetical protein
VAASAPATLTSTRSRCVRPMYHVVNRRVMVPSR